MKKLIAILIALSLLLCGCGGSGTQAQELSSSHQPRTDHTGIPENKDALIGSFGLELLKTQAFSEKNVLISPISILTALAMTASGARENTLTQMEQVLGAPIGDLNALFGGYRDSLRGHDGCALYSANSIWIKDTPSLVVEDSFLQTNADCYGAGIFRAAFDSETLSDINGWVEENTDGQIKDMLDRIDPDAVMYLVNALAFEARWKEIYETYQVNDAVFTTEGGLERTVEMMYSQEDLFLETDQATGFLKYYEDGRYAFAVLLPDKGISLSEMVTELDGRQLRHSLQNPTEIIVHAGLPKFETGFDLELSQLLKDLGMTDAFNWQAADFSGMGRTTDGTNLCIGRVLHKTRITVAEEGTKAGAATMVEMRAEGAMEIQESRIVTLDRPFLYMIVDTELMEPVFLGTLADPAA